MERLAQTAPLARVLVPECISYYFVRHRCGSDRLRIQSGEVGNRGPVEDLTEFIET